MPDSVLEAYIRQVFDSCDREVASFAWQGGEPTLAGLEFFRRAVDIQRSLCPPGVRIENAFQTNGVLLDDDWCRFLAENRFLVGLSLDGPRRLHDANRTFRSGRPSFERVMEGLRALQRHRVEVNVLTTVNSANAGSPLEVYRFLRDEAGVAFIQFIPVVEVDPSLPKGVSQHSVGTHAYGDFLVAIFDEWVRADVGRVFVQIFEVALAVTVGLPSTLCVFAETCGDAVILEHNGDVYSCDHYVDRQHLLGNILDRSVEELVSSQRQRNFGESKRESLPSECWSCAVRRYCNGGCPKNRMRATSEDGRPQNHLCPSYKRFFSHVQRPLALMAQALRRGEPASTAMSAVKDEDRRVRKAGRNEPCPCGSGRKRKHCRCRT